MWIRMWIIKKSNRIIKVINKIDTSSEPSIISAWSKSWAAMGANQGWAEWYTVQTVQYWIFTMIWIYEIIMNYLIWFNLPLRNWTWLLALSHSKRPLVDTAAKCLVLHTLDISSSRFSSTSRFTSEGTSIHVLPRVDPGGLPDAIRFY